MPYINDDTEKNILVALGQRLRSLRLWRNESQDVMAARLCVTRQTYARMEKGDPRIPIGAWVAASALFSRLDDWEHLLVEQEDLFLRAEIEQALAKRKRKRASGR